MRRTARLGVAGQLLFAVTLVAATPEARAAGPRLLLDRAELEPSWFPGLARLRLHVTPIQLEGSLIPVTGSDPFVLLVSGSRRREPYLLGRYGGTGAATAVVIVVHTGWEMRDDFDSIREAIDRLVAGLPAETQVAVVSYGEAVEGGHRLAPARGAGGRQVERLEPDAAPAEPLLLSAVERAVVTLGRTSSTAGAGPPLRRLVVVLSDGKDVDPDPARYREIGVRAQRQAIRVHSIAYSPVDDRGPLLGLGELSKRSGGTFRWVRSREGFGSQVDTLLAEIDQQVVLTYFVVADQVVGKRLAVGFRDLESNEVRLKKPECGGRACGEDEFCARHACVARADGGAGRVWRWLLWGGGGLVALLLLVGLVGSLFTRSRRPAAAQGAPLPGPGPVAGGAPYGAPRGAPYGAPHGAPYGTPHGAPVGTPHGAPIGTPHGAQVAASLPATAASLLVAAGPYQGQRMPLRHGFLVGSARGCDFLVPGDPQVAPHHAMFVMDASGAFGLIDRGSATGTFVNGVRITETRLQHGNLIRIGGTSLRFLAQ